MTNCVALIVDSSTWQTRRVMKVTPNIPNAKPNQKLIMVRPQKTHRSTWNCLKTKFFRRFFRDPRNVSDHKISQFQAIFNLSTSPESPHNLPGGVWWFRDPTVTSCRLKLCQKLKKLEKRRKSCAFSPNFLPLHVIKFCRKSFGGESTFCWG